MSDAIPECGNAGIGRRGETRRYAHDVAATRAIAILCGALAACSGMNGAASMPGSAALSATAASIEVHMRFLVVVENWLDELTRMAPGS
jgi:hypothetical protein